MSRVIVDPRVVEEHMPTGQTQALGKRSGLLDNRHLRNTWVGVGRSHEEQTDRWARFSERGNSANQGEGIKPVVDAPTPDDEGIICTDSWDHTTQYWSAVFGRAVGESEGNYSEKPRKMRVVLVCGRTNSAERCQLAQIEMALAL